VWGLHALDSYCCSSSGGSKEVAAAGPQGLLLLTSAAYMILQLPAVPLMHASCTAAAAVFVCGVLLWCRASLTMQKLRLGMTESTPFQTITRCGPEHSNFLQHSACV
jgi:hypothetical protein